MKSKCFLCCLFKNFQFKKQKIFFSKKKKDILSKKKNKIKLFKDKLYLNKNNHYEYRTIMV